MIAIAKLPRHCFWSNSYLSIIALVSHVDVLILVIVVFRFQVFNVMRIF